MAQSHVMEWTKDWSTNSNLQVLASPSVSSTNDFAKSFSYQSIEPVLFLAGHQTAGRGRGTNTWADSSGSLLSTWSFGLASAPQPITTPLIGLSVVHALDQTLRPRNLSLKAPNDIFIGGKKAGGILVEVLSAGNEHRLLIGLGLNVFQPAPLETAATLEGHLQVPLTQEHWTEFLSALLVEFTQAIATCTQSQLPVSARTELAKWLNKNANLPEPVLSVDPDGSIRTQTGRISWTTI